MRTFISTHTRCKAQMANRQNANPDRTPECLYCWLHVRSFVIKLPSITRMDVWIRTYGRTIGKQTSRQAGRETDRCSLPITGKNELVLFDTWEYNFENCSPSYSRNTAETALQLSRQTTTYMYFAAILSFLLFFE